MRPTQLDNTFQLRRTLAATCGNSFLAGTLVATAASPVAIEDVAVGDRVLAEDPGTGEQAYFEVVAVTNHPTDEVLAVTVAAVDDDGGDEGQSSQTSVAHDVLQVTPDHPLYVEDEGWLLAENLELGDRLRRADGGMAKVLALERLQLDTPQPVYNFTVKGPHTYFVLDAEVLVHNAGCESEIASEPGSRIVYRALSRTEQDTIAHGHGILSTEWGEPHHNTARSCRRAQSPCSPDGRCNHGRSAFAWASCARRRRVGSGSWSTAETGVSCCKVARATPAAF